MAAIAHILRRTAQALRLAADILEPPQPPKPTATMNGQPMYPSDIIVYDHITGRAYVRSTNGYRLA